MARPRKTGLDYFPLDVVLDDKVEALECEHGCEGFTVWIKILQLAYQTEHGELNLTEVFRRKTLAKRANIDVKTLERIIETCVIVGLFDKDRWHSEMILTSAGIKARIDGVSDERRRNRERKESSPSSPPLSKTKEEKSKSKSRGNPPLSGGKPLENNSSPLWGECVYFRCSELEMESIASWYRKKNKTPAVMNAVLEAVEDWMAQGTTPIARSARKAPTHFRYLRNLTWVSTIERSLATNGAQRSRPATFVEQLDALRAKDNFNAIDVTPNGENHGPTRNLHDTGSHLSLLPNRPHGPTRY